MEIDLTKTLIDLEGEPIGASKTCAVLEADEQSFKKNEDGSLLYVKITEPGNALTIKKVMTNCLLSEAPIDGKEKIDREEKSTRYDIYFKIGKANDSVELSMAEIAKIQDILWVSESTYLAGQACAILEGKI